MALDDLGDKKSDENQGWLQEQQEEELQEIADELGIEDKEDLEWLDDRLSKLAAHQVQYNKEVAELKEEISRLERVIQAILTVMSDRGLMKEYPDVEPAQEDTSSRWQSTQ